MDTTEQAKINGNDHSESARQAAWDAFWTWAIAGLGDDEGDGAHASPPSFFACFLEPRA
jgi:hypothetical protein